MQRMFVIALVLIAFAISASAQTPWIFANDGSGKYLGQLSSNPLAPDSVSNPIGRYGSPISPYSARNPLAVQAPVIIAPHMPYIAAPLAPLPGLRPLAPLRP